MKVREKLLLTLLYDLEAFSYDTSQNRPFSPDSLRQLGVLIQHIKETHAAEISELSSLLEHGEITFDLLWALFHPKMKVHAVCHGVDEPRYVRYKSGNLLMIEGTPVFRIKVSYIDFDGTKLF